MDFGGQEVMNRRCWSFVKEEGQVGNGEFVGFTRKSDKVDTSYQLVSVMFYSSWQYSWFANILLGEGGRESLL